MTLNQRCIWMLVACCLPAETHAQITDFNNLSGWTYNQTDSGLPAAVGTDFITLTTGRNQNRSVWFNTKQNIDQFTASFRYESTGVSIGGLSFIVHDDPEGLDVASSPGTLFGFRGISPSAAVTIERVGSGFGTALQTGIFRNGIGGTGSERIPSAEELDVTIRYDGSLINVTIDDGVNTPFVRNTIITPSLADALGSSEAFVGFGAAVGDRSSQFTQTIRDFRFTSSAAAVPEPSAAIALLGVATLSTIRRRR